MDAAFSYVELSLGLFIFICNNTKFSFVCANR